jgi:hypothetical protein
MKRSFSVVAIAALFAVLSAFAGKAKVQVGQWWNVDHPFQGTPGIFFGSATQIKGWYCPGANNVECAYAVGGVYQIIKKPF